MKVYVLISVYMRGDIKEEQIEGIYKTEEWANTNKNSLEIEENRRMRVTDDYIESQFRIETHELEE